MPKKDKVPVPVQIGDEALAGREEKDIQIHTFPPNSQRARKIAFKGLYLSIYNKQTGHYATYIDNESPTTEYLGYDVPAGYSVHVRGGSVYFTAL